MLCPPSHPVQNRETTTRHRPGTLYGHNVSQHTSLFSLTEPLPMLHTSPHPLIFGTHMPIDPSLPVDRKGRVIATIRRTRIPHASFHSTTLTSASLFLSVCHDHHQHASTHHTTSSTLNAHNEDIAGCIHSFVTTIRLPRCIIVGFFVADENV